MSKRQLAWLFSAISFAGISAVCYIGNLDAFGYGASIVSIFMFLEAWVKDEE